MFIIGDRRSYKFEYCGVSGEKGDSEFVLFLFKMDNFHDLLRVAMLVVVLEFRN